MDRSGYFQYGLLLMGGAGMDPRPPRRERMNRKGFTLIELLIVILFLSVLATIAISAFPFMRAKAGNAAAKSDLKNAAIFQEDYYAVHDTYADQPALDAGFQTTENVSVTVVSASDGGYDLAATHAASSETFCLSSADGAVLDC
jgi:prepilin-type N-terminal cleavage/methylation domain-containing protein